MELLAGDEANLDEIYSLKGILFGLGTEIRIIIYRILLKKSGYRMKKKALQVELIGASKKPVQDNTFNFHLQKMESAGLLEVKRDMIRLLKIVKINIEEV